MGTTGWSDLPIDLKRSLFLLIVTTFILLDPRTILIIAETRSIRGTSCVVYPTLSIQMEPTQVPLLGVNACKREPTATIVRPASSRARNWICAVLPMVFVWCLYPMAHEMPAVSMIAMELKILAVIASALVLEAISMICG